MADSVKIKITADDTDYRSKMDGLEGITKKGATKVAAVAGAIGGAVSSLVSSAITGLKQLASEAITASDALTKFDSTMSFAGFGAKEIETARKAVKKYADETVFELSDVSNTTAQLAANGIKDYVGLTEAAGNLTAVAGGGADAFKAVAMMLTQTAGAGKLTTENWNQLSDAIPGASGKLQEAMEKNGAYTGNFRDAMAKGEITADEFNQALMDLGMSDVAKEAATSTATFEGAFGNLKANVISGITDIIDKIGKDKITGAITKVSDAIVTVFDIVTKVIGFIADHANIFGPLAAALGAVTVATWLWNAALNANPISLIIIGIAALVAGILWLWDNCSAFRDGVLAIWESIKTVWDTISPYLSAAWEVIKSIFSAAIDVIISIFQSAWTAIKAVWDLVQPYFQALWDGIVLIFSVVVDFFRAIFETAWNAIKFVWDAATWYFRMIWENIKLVFSVVAAVLSGDFSAAWDGIKAIWNNAVSFFLGIWEGIKGVFAPVISFFSEMWQGAFNAVKSFFTIENFKKVFEDSICGGLRGVIESVKTAAGEVWDSIQAAFNKTIKLFFGFGGAEGEGYATEGGTGSLSPFNSGRISSAYGVRRKGGKVHTGIDFASPIGTPIQSTTNGVVTKVANLGGKSYGKYVVVRDNNGYSHYYAHMSKQRATVGMPVGRGMTIGYVGSTGNSTGPHLHYEVRRPGGGHINPQPWWKGARGYATGGFPGIGEMFYANENGIELMGKMGKKNVIANNMQIIEGIKAGIASGAVQAARVKANAGNTNTNTEINLNQHFYKENVSPSETKRAARRGVKTALAGGTS